MGQLILITGSRDATSEMCTTADEAVVWIHHQGHTLIVGEAPGIDEVCRLACERLGMAPFVCGAKNRFRQPAINAAREQRVVIRAGYLARDRVMAQRCDRGIAIMLAPRTKGTWYTGTYAEGLGKRVRWAVWDAVGQSWSYYHKSEDISGEMSG